MKNTTSLLVLLISTNSIAISQSRFQALFSGGSTYTPGVEYRNCTGHISKSFTGSLALLYQINSSFGLEFKFSALAYPTSYLENDISNTLKNYTISRFVFQRLLAGFNYYIPLKGVHPFVGIVAGASYAETTAFPPYPSTISFNAGVQTGATVKIARSIALRLDACALLIPGVSNSSPYFNTDNRSSSYPLFILGNPSSATITQYNVNLGVLIAFGKSKK